MIDNGDKCPKCQMASMPKIPKDSKAIGRMCQNPFCRFIEILEPKEESCKDPKKKNS